VTDLRARWLPIFLVWLVLCAAHLGLSVRSLSLPGPYYDEVIQAVPALDFLRGHARALPLPGARSIDVLGRPFPWQIQPYMGGLKSQLLIPSFGLFGARVEVLRLTTTLWALVGLLLVMLWARRVLGTPVALVAGALLALDPSLLFVARHDWGSMALGLLLRGAGLWLATRWWSSRRPLELAAAGLALGLGIHNKVDFAPFLAAAATMLVVCRPDVLQELWGRDRRCLAWGLAGLAAGAAPAILATSETLRAASTVAILSSFGEKLSVVWAMLDGSYFHRLMAVGGRFPQLFDPELEAPSSFLGFAYLGSAVILLFIWTRHRPATSFSRAAGYVVGTAVLTQAGLLLIPGAVRIHHALNVYPFPHLVVATAAVAAWRASARLRRGRPLARTILACGLAAILATNGVVSFRTLALIERGGRGWWSDAIEDFARDVDRQPEATVISLDWGFQQPLVFLTEETHLIEPFWYFRQNLQRGHAWTHRGSARTVYLVHEREYELYGFGLRFIEAVSRIDPGLVERRPYREREGGVVFLAVRILREHSLRYRANGFDLELL
jgi:hypothetical protein